MTTWFITISKDLDLKSNIFCRIREKKQCHIKNVISFQSLRFLWRQPIIQMGRKKHQKEQKSVLRHDNYTIIANDKNCFFNSSHVTPSRGSQGPQKHKKQKKQQKRKKEFQEKKNLKLKICSTLKAVLLAPHEKEKMTSWSAAMSQVADGLQLWVTGPAHDAGERRCLRPLEYTCLQRAGLVALTQHGLLPNSGLFLFLRFFYFVCETVKTNKQPKKKPQNNMWCVLSPTHRRPIKGLDTRTLWMFLSFSWLLRLHFLTSGIKTMDEHTRNYAGSNERVK